MGDQRSSSRSEKTRRKKEVSQDEMLSNASTHQVMVGAASGGLRRQRQSVGSFASFRIDSNDRKEHRESSLTRGYDALGVELHSLEDREDAESRNLGCLGSQRSQSKAGVPPRKAAGGQGHAPFAAAMEHGASKGSRGCAGSRSVSASAMSLDIGRGLTSRPILSPVRKSASTSQLRALSTETVSKSKSTSQFLPALSASKSSQLLPALSSAKHRSADPMAWSIGSSRSKWGSVGGSLF